MANQKNVNVKTIRTAKQSAIKYWLMFLKPYHKLRNKEIEALSIMIYYRYELLREIKKEDIVDIILFSTETRNKIRKELNNMNQKVFNNLLTSLRNKGVLTTSNKIISSLIPAMDETGFKLVFNFELQNETE